MRFQTTSLFIALSFTAVVACPSQQRTIDAEDVNGGTAHYSATTDSPTQNNFGLPTDLEVSGTSVSFTIHAPGGSAEFKGKFSSTVISGTFIQAGTSLPLLLKRPWVINAVKDAKKKQGELSGDWEGYLTPEMPLVLHIAGTPSKQKVTKGVNALPPVEKADPSSNESPVTADSTGWTGTWLGNITTKVPIEIDVQRAGLNYRGENYYVASTILSGLFPTMTFDDTKVGAVKNSLIFMFATFDYTTFFPGKYRPVYRGVANVETFMATIDKDVMSGTFDAGTRPQQLRLTRMQVGVPSENPEGQWVGGEIEITFPISVVIAKAANGYTGSTDLPNQRMIGLPTQVNAREKTLELKAAYDFQYENPHVYLVISGTKTENKVEGTYTNGQTKQSSKVILYRTLADR